MVQLPCYADASFQNKVLDISSEEYHGLRTHVHQSSLKHMLKSANSFMFYQKKPLDPTKSMRLGSLGHAAILDGKNFLKNYVVEPTFVGKTKDGKETTSKSAHSVQMMFEEWKTSLAPEVKIITQPEMDQLRWMLDALLEHSFAFDVLKNTMPEVKMQWRDPLTGFQCACEHDFISLEKSIWGDVKTCSDAEWEIFKHRNVEKMRLDFQMAFYQDAIKEVWGIEMKHKLWIAIEQGGSYQCEVHPVNQLYETTGRASYKKAILDLARAIEKNDWSQKQKEVSMGEPSKWFIDMHYSALNAEAVGLG